MVPRQRTLMVALRDPDRSSGPLLRKAARLAKLQRAVVLLVHVIALPRSSARSATAAVRNAAHDMTRQRTRQLRQLAASVGLRGVRTEVEVVWDYPVSHALVRLVLKHKPALLLVESQRHSRLARLWLTNTDWDLIRNCPCPVWLGKDRSLSLRPQVLAAIDPFHSHAKPASLDRAILQQAVDVAGGKPQRVFACHAYNIPPVVSDSAVEGYWPSMSEDERVAHRRKVELAIDRSVRAHDIPAANCRLLEGDPAQQIARAAQRLGCDVLVMGAVSRSALERLFIGHTAERLIDAVPCDVLIVKPRGFRTGVARRALSF